MSANYPNLSTLIPPLALYQGQPANPTAPSSTSSYQMQGLGQAATIQPNFSGKVRITISGNFIAADTTINDGILLQVSYGTGNAPVVNGALAGTQIGAITEYTNPAAVTANDVHIPFSVEAVATGLAVGTVYWADLAAKAVTTASDIGLSNLNVIIQEIL